MNNNIINRVKDSVSENPYRQIWKYIRLFLDEGYVVRRIKSVHNITENKYDSDVRKQANQVNYCVRQAEEYFKASEYVNLVVRPTVMYYGAVALSKALTLINLNGESSFDYLRKNNKHKHHGLDMKKLPNKSNSFIDFYENIECEIHSNNGKPWGHFPIFYKSLSQPTFQINKEIYDSRRQGMTSTLKHTQGCANIIDLDTLIRRKFKIIDVMKTIPDLWYTLFEVGIKPSLFRSNVESEVKMEYENNDQLRMIIFTDRFIINNIQSDEKISYIKFLKSKIPTLQIISDIEPYLFFQINENCQENQPRKIKYYPDIVDSINGELFFIQNPDEYIVEPAAMLLILFCMSMLSRYHPDIWVSTIDGSAEFRELTDSFLNVCQRKFPNLILDQMSGIKHNVHL